MARQTRKVCYQPSTLFLAPAILNDPRCVDIDNEDKQAFADFVAHGFTFGCFEFDDTKFDGIEYWPCNTFGDVVDAQSRFPALKDAIDDGAYFIKSRCGNFTIASFNACRHATDDDSDNDKWIAYFPIWALAYLVNTNCQEQE